MPDRINILDLSLDELREYFILEKEKEYRAAQVYEWLYRGVDSFEEMLNLSKSLRKVLSSRYKIDKLKIYKVFTSEIDGTTKFLFELQDGNIIETVFMKYKHGNSVCISSQVGCRMGCSFCASGELGLIRNLSVGEMVDQILATSKYKKEKINNIVIMGIGEPFDNYDNLIKFLKNINDKKGINIGFRHISVSTCGLVNKIYDFLDEKLPVTLSISLHSSEDNTRKKIMPITNKYSIDKLIKACKIYTETLRRRITFEYTMISGVNDKRIDAEKLSKRLKGLLCHVNLIPVNEIEGNDIKRSRNIEINNFKDILIKNGIETTVRRELGYDIEAACGQLRRGILK